VIDISNAVVGHAFMRRKLKYVIEAQVPLPSHRTILCIRATGGTGESLNSIASAALRQLLEMKWQKLCNSVHDLLMFNTDTSGRKRDERGRYMRGDHRSKNEVEEHARKREHARLVSTYEAILSKAVERHKVTRAKIDA